MIIDAHHHLWRYDPADYGWIDESMSVIARDFTPDDLVETTTPLGVTGTVAVQARQSLEETTWLLELADASDKIAGVVGWAPLVEATVGETLDQLTSAAKLKGFRHVVQDEPDDNFLLRDDFNHGVNEVLKRDLVYDVLIFERQLPAAIGFVDRHPTRRFVLDHIAKPRIAAGELEPWRANLAELAKRENVTCKLSGVVTEADWQTWSAESIRPYLDATLDAFGPRRLMFGSDWPVCLIASEYDRWLATVHAWAAPLSADEQDALFAQTAIAAYGLEVPSNE